MPKPRSAKVGVRLDESGPRHHVDGHRMARPVLEGLWTMVSALHQRPFFHPTAPTAEQRDAFEIVG